MSISRLFQVVYAAHFVLLAILGVFVVLLVDNQKDLAQSHKVRFESRLLADQLRQSSEDLTRMAQAYVATGNPKFEEDYWHILAIRNGSKPPPEHYQRFYWGVIPPEVAAPGAHARAVPLETLMEEMGFTEAEFGKQKEAQASSDSLVRTEEIAMNAMKGHFDDGAGHFTKRGEPDQKLAIRHMFDEDYHRRKAAILQPIGEFFMLLENRTRATVEELGQRSSRLLYSILGMLIVLAVMTGASRLVIARKLSVSTPLDCSTRDHGGSGLGLSMSSQLIQMMGGPLQLQSEPGTFQAATLFHTIAEVLSPEQPKVRTDAERGSPHLDNHAFKGDPLALDPALHKELAGMFLEDGPRLIALIREAIDGCNASDLKLAAAQTLKGSAGVFKDQPGFEAALQRCPPLSRRNGRRHHEAPTTQLDVEIAMVVCRYCPRPVT